MSRQQVGEIAAYTALIVMAVVAVVSSQRYFTGFFNDSLAAGAAITVFIALVCACCFLIRQPLRISLALIAFVAAIAAPVAIFDSADLRKIMTGLAIFFETIGLLVAFVLIVLGFRFGSPMTPRLVRAGAIIAASIFSTAAISILSDMAAKTGGRTKLVEYIDLVQVALWCYLVPVALFGMLVSVGLVMLPKLARAGSSTAKS